MNVDDNVDVLRIMMKHIEMPLIDLVACRGINKICFAESISAINASLRRMYHTVVGTFDNDVFAMGDNGCLMLTGGSLLALIIDDPQWKREGAIRGDFDFVGTTTGAMMSPTQKLAVSYAHINVYGRITGYSRAHNYEDTSAIHVDLLNAVSPTTYLDSFDFSFCSNLMWVENFDDCERIHVRMWDPLAIMTRRFVMTGNGLVNLVKVNIYDDQMASYKMTINRRLERFRIRSAKYTSRGFTIVEDFTREDCERCWFDEYDRQSVVIAVK